MPAAANRINFSSKRGVGANPGDVFLGDMPAAANRINFSAKRGVGAARDMYYSGTVAAAVAVTAAGTATVLVRV